MLNTNGRGPKKAILYARVSTDEQARSGYSLAQQMEALRAFAAREGYDILEEVLDPGQSGASLARPGMDRVRDLVAAGSVSVVLAQDRDRFAREPAYHYLLKQEFGEHGTAIRALNDRGDGSPEGELTDGILDQLAKFERAKVAERTRRGKLRKAKEGKVIAGYRTRYGFCLNVARDGYEVEEEKMDVVRRIVNMIADGMALRAVKQALDRGGVPTPHGTRFWNRSFVRDCVLDDAYRAHTFKEVAAIVSPEVAARLDPHKRYGLWWFNRHRMIGKPVSEISESGRRYAKRYTKYVKPREEWIAVPVPDSGIPREVVERAREAIRSNRVPSRAGGRFWELSGGVARCGACGRRMRVAHRTKKRKTVPSRTYGYYRCPGYTDHVGDGCSNGRAASAAKLEAQAWEFVKRTMMEPEELTRDLDRMIELKREGPRGDPREEAKMLLEELGRLERMRDGYHDQTAEGLLKLDKLRAKLDALDDRQEAVERELGTLRGRGEELERLKRDRDAVVEHYAALAPEALECLGPEERHGLYGMLRLKVFVNEDGEAWAEMPIGPAEPLKNSGGYGNVVTSTFARTGGRS